MQDHDIFGRISELVDEERGLRERGELDHSGKQRLDALEVQLDQCWDLLRQRRGLRHAGEDASEARVRDANIVEHYQQ